MLRINNCQITLRNGRILLPDIDLPASQLLVITGPSGIGKSTLLHWLLGDSIRHADINGEIHLRDRCLNDVKIENRRLGLLMQDVHLFPHLNVLENICFALPQDLADQHNKKLNKAERQAKAKHMLESIELGYLAKQYSEQLSGGERSRVGLVRALANQPQALLMDEPFSALDPAAYQQVSQWAFEQLREREVPSIMVSHDLSHIPQSAQHLALDQYFEPL